MDSPPLLVAWIACEFSQDLKDVASMTPFLQSMGYSFDAEEKAPKVIDGDVIRLLSIWTTADKRNAVGLSRRELYFITSDYADFPNFLETFIKLGAEVFTKLPDGAKFKRESVNFFNVFESSGLVCDLIKPNLQGFEAPNQKAHQHRTFQFSDEFEDQTWLQCISRYIHGDQYIPNIRRCLEKHLSLKLEFEAVREIDAHQLILSVDSRIPRDVQDTASLFRRSKLSIDKYFISAITEKAKTKWKLQLK
jgi:uncharacterized protein (TIGR04255 family)